eukprot:gene17190-biopygen10225
MVSLHSSSRRGPKDHPDDVYCTSDLGPRQPPEGPTTPARRTPHAKGGPDAPREARGGGAGPGQRGAAAEQRQAYDDGGGNSDMVATVTVEESTALVTEAATTLPMAAAARRRGRRAPSRASNGSSDGATDPELPEAKPMTWGMARAPDLGRPLLPSISRSIGSRLSNALAVGLRLVHSPPPMGQGAARGSSVRLRLLRLTCFHYTPYFLYILYGARRTAWAALSPPIPPVLVRHA